MKCDKWKCVNHMYLMCDVCNTYIYCFPCGYPIKYVDGNVPFGMLEHAKHYCEKHEGSN